MSELWIGDNDYTNQVNFLADGSIEVSNIQVPQQNFVVEIAYLKNSVYFTGPTLLSFKLYDNERIVISEDAQFQLQKNNFAINSISKSVQGSEIILDIDFTFESIVDFPHYLRVQLNNGVVKAGTQCISAASFSYDFNSICENVNETTLKIKDLLASAPFGQQNNLRVKILNPNAASSVDVTIDIFPDTAEVSDIDDPNSDVQIAQSATASVAL